MPICLVPFVIRRHATAGLFARQGDSRGPAAVASGSKGRTGRVGCPYALPVPGREVVERYELALVLHQAVGCLRMLALPGLDEQVECLLCILPGVGLPDVVQCRPGLRLCRFRRGAGDVGGLHASSNASGGSGQRLLLRCLRPLAPPPTASFGAFMPRAFSPRRASLPSWTCLRTPSPVARRRLSPLSLTPRPAGRTLPLPLGFEAIDAVCTHTSTQRSRSGGFPPTLVVLLPRGLEAEDGACMPTPSHQIRSATRTPGSSRRWRRS